MGRCKKKRYCRKFEGSKIFKPKAVPLTELEIVEIELDEFEAVRLCDNEGLSQIDAAEKMKISRGTIQRLLIKGRFKITDALVNNKGLIINNK